MKLSVANRFRWSAALCYAALSVYQMFMAKSLTQSTALADMNVISLYAVGIIFFAAAMAVWMFSGKAVLSGGARRAVVGGTALCLLMEIISYKMQTNIIGFTLYYYWPDFFSRSNINQWLYFFLIFRIALMIAGALFAWNSREELDYVPKTLKDVAAEEDLLTKIERERKEAEEEAATVAAEVKVLEDKVAAAEAKEFAEEVGDTIAGALLSNAVTDEEAVALLEELAEAAEDAADAPKENSKN